MTDSVLLSKDELQELIDIRLPSTHFSKCSTRTPETSDGNEAAAVLQPIARWLGDFVDQVQASGLLRCVGEYTNRTDRDRKPFRRR